MSNDESIKNYLYNNSVQFLGKQGWLIRREILDKCITYVVERTHFQETNNMIVKDSKDRNYVYLLMSLKESYKTICNFYKLSVCESCKLFWCCLFD